MSQSHGPTVGWRGPLAVPASGLHLPGWEPLPPGFSPSQGRAAEAPSIPGAHPTHSSRFNSLGWGESGHL